MEKRKVMVIMLLSAVLAGSDAAAALVYESFESYVVGREGTGLPGDLWLSWMPADAGNPYLTPYVDGVIKYAGNKSMRLDAPLVGNGGDPNEGWGVIIRDKDLTTNVSAYNVLIAMVRADSNSSIIDCSIEVRDSGGTTVGSGDYIAIPHDSNWHQIITVLNGPGDKTLVEQLLLWFNMEPNAPGVHQFWIDDIKFEHMLAVDDILDADVNGLFGNAGGTVKYSFVMTEQPPVDVNFTLSPDELLDFGAGFGEPVVITFTNSNWNIRQEITIDISSAASGVLTVGTSASSTSTDPNYNEALPGSFDVPILGQYSASYVISPNTPTWYGAGSDNSGIDLANGAVAPYLFDSEGYLDEDWVEWAPDQESNPPYAEITFDFGYAKDVNSVDIYHAADGYPPGSFELSYSLDDVNYTTPTVHEPSLGDVVSKTHIEVSPAVNARYVKLVTRCDANDPGNWVFLSEVEFNGQMVPPYYIIDPNNIPQGDHMDSWRGKLMNGVISYLDDSTHTDWVYFDDVNYIAYNNVILYANYGEIKEFSNISLNYYTDANVYAPADVNLSFSDDGVTYGTPISLTSWYQGSGSGGRTDAKSFAPKTGQYVKIHIVRNTANAYCLRLGEIILSNRPQMTYTVDGNTPVWGGSTDEPGDVATEPNLQTLKFGDLANGYIPAQAGPYNDRDWVEWAPDQFGAPAYGLITFDLKSVVKVKNVAIVYSSNYLGTHSPGGLEAAFSSDGVNFSAMTDVGAVFSENPFETEIFNTTFDLPDTDAQYVKLKIRCKNNNASNWFFISEVKFNVFAADLNDDGAVNFKDIKRMADQWLQSGSGLSADIAGNDGQVNFLDFAGLAMEWMD